MSLVSVPWAARHLLRRSSRFCTTVKRSQPPTSAVSSIFYQRSYATHRADPQGTSSLLNQAFEQKQNNAQQEYRDSVGPIPLGMIRPSIKYNEKVKNWSELSTGGKVARATARTGNLTVILLGAGLTAVLIYALTSELFSPNSPTVVYSQACDKIKASPRISQYLHAPLKFHNTPPSAVRPRHRNPHVSSQIAVDSSGREHMFLTFFVSSSANAPKPASENYLERVQEQFSELSEMSWDDVTSTTRTKAEGAWESIQAGVRYLVGKPASLIAPTPSHEAEVAKQEAEKGAWSFVGLFSSLRGSKQDGNGTSAALDEQFTEGEVHAELIRNDDGYFVFRYLLVDIPNSRTRQRSRVYVERAPGVSEREPVMHWG